ncbi:peptidylprolyl isomerase [Flavihumibacter sp. CACIAM 22H1]|uniref:peptidylprolyl isomerase n=1 Tax=Flavihumibacter sp. CACIAM 22H1 TaxID=1812911 RepID=UPI0007A837B0|nr:peptidylprolyl isomerase [Flavihumibacter sp. CACIAM 22H1]KYP13908.1 MAG: peptidylprolyl isomerase [Flavihumibacter sp. CACIAM 22H1]
MLKRIIVLVAGCLLMACNSRPTNSHTIEIEIKTAEGTIIAELYADKAPKSVKAFLAIVDQGLYKRTGFYRILSTDNQPSNAPKAELVQGGLWSSTKKRPDLPTIPHESTRQTGLTHTAGTLSFARQEPGTASSEFFITLSDLPGFDFGGENNADGQGYAAFGKVISGMDIVRKIYRKPETDQYFDPPVLILDIQRH